MKDFKDDSKSDFFNQVYQVVLQIPKGRVTSYGAIAKFLGAAKSSRLVGYAMNSAHSLPFDVPAHRVVNRNGVLTGKNHFASPTKMAELLQSEGIVVIDDQIENFQAVFWDPRRLVF